MIIRSKWAQEHFESIKDDPEYIAAGLMIKLNEQICIRMKEQGLSQRDLAKRIGCSQPNVWKLLNHGNNMTLKTLVTIAQALEMEIEPIVLRRKDFQRELTKEVHNHFKSLIGKRKRLPSLEDYHNVKKFDIGERVDGEVQNAA